MGEKKIVVDTNTLISALGWDGNPRILFGKIIEGDFQWFIPLKQLAELKRVLSYPKFKDFLNL